MAVNYSIKIKVEHIWIRQTEQMQKTDYSWKNLSLKLIKFVTYDRSWSLIKLCKMIKSTAKDATGWVRDIKLKMK